LSGTPFRRYGIAEVHLALPGLLAWGHEGI
jgi:hypothetical protein